MAAEEGRIEEGAKGGERKQTEDEAEGAVLRSYFQHRLGWLTEQLIEALLFGAGRPGLARVVEATVVQGQGGEEQPMKKGGAAHGGP